LLVQQVVFSSNLTNAQRHAPKRGIKHHVIAVAFVYKSEFFVLLSMRLGIPTYACNPLATPSLDLMNDLAHSNVECLEGKLSMSNPCISPSLRYMTAKTYLLG